MSIKAFSLIVFLSIGFGAFSQTQISSTPTSLEEVRNYEDSIKSIAKGLHHFNPYYDEDFEDIYENWPPVKKKTLIFKRTNDDFFPALHSWYFFDKDSVAKWFKYNWGFANTKVEVSNYVIKKQTLRKKEFIRKYKAEKANLINQLGIPTKEDAKTENASYLTMKSIWNLTDKRVVLSMTVDKNVVEFNPKEVNRKIVFPRSKIEIKVMLKE